MDADEDFLRLERWMRRSKVLLHDITPDGAELLEQRLRMRDRAHRICVGLAIASVVVVLFGVVPALTPVRSIDGRVGWLIVSVALACAATLAETVLVVRGERRLVLDLPRRVAAEVATAPWRRVGVLRLTSCAVVLVATAAMVTAVLQSGVPLSVALLYVGLATGATALTLADITAGLTRPTIAVDEASLRVDDRWRSQAMYLAMTPALFTFAIGALVRT